MLRNQLIERDLASMERIEDALLEGLSDRVLLITGGTGFFGKWLLEALQLARRRYGLRLRILVLSRNPTQRLLDAPHLLNSPGVEFIRGDVRTWTGEGRGITHVMHAANAASSPEADEVDLFDAIVTGTRRIVDLAVNERVERFLYVSSGAVYGPQPIDVTHVDETAAAGLDPLCRAHPYVEGKRTAEAIVAAQTAEAQLPAVIARGFAFVGPYLPLDSHFAVASFLRNLVEGEPIRVSGDGTPWRSYLHGADLAVWLLTMLLRGAPGTAYNVGSEDAYQIGDVARKVASIDTPARRVVIAAPGPMSARALRYVPSTALARTALAVEQTISLDEAIRRTAAWLSS